MNFTKIHDSDIEVNPQKRIIAIETFIRLLQREMELFPPNEKPDNFSDFSVQDNYVLRRTLSSLICQFDKVEGGEEALRNFNLISNLSSDWIQEIWAESFIGLRDKGGWMKELNESLYTHIKKN